MKKNTKSNIPVFPSRFKHFEISKGKDLVQVIIDLKKEKKTIIFSNQPQNDEIKKLVDYSQTFDEFKKTLLNLNQVEQIIILSNLENAKEIVNQFPNLAILIPNTKTDNSNTEIVDLYFCINYSCVLVNPEKNED